MSTENKRDYIQVIMKDGEKVDFLPSDSWNTLTEKVDFTFRANYENLYVLQLVSLEE